MGLLREALVATGLLFDGSGAVLSDPIGGDELLAICQSSGDKGEAFCDGYVVGSLESMKWGAYVVLERSFGDNYPVSKLNFFANQLLGFCVPAEATKIEIVGMPCEI